MSSRSDVRLQNRRSGRSSLASVVMLGWYVLAVVAWRAALALVPDTGGADCTIGDPGCQMSVHDALALSGSSFGVPGLVVALLVGLLVVRFVERRRPVRVLLHGSLAALLGLGLTALVVGALLGITAV